MLGFGELIQNSSKTLVDTAVVRHDIELQRLAHLVSRHASRAGVRYRHAGRNEGCDDTQSAARRRCLLVAHKVTPLHIPLSTSGVFY